MFRIHQEGLPYQPARSRLSEDAILSRVVSLPKGRIPEWADFTTLGIDVQADRVFWMEIAWGVERVRGHIVNWGQFPGEMVAQHENLNMLLRLNRSKPLVRAFIDSGDGNTTGDVYGWSNTHNQGVRPIKGRVGLSDESTNRQFIANSHGPEHDGKLLILEVNLIKDYFAKLMEREIESGVSISYPLEVADDVSFQRQMVSEERRSQTGANGKTRSGWFVRDGYGANHWWDCAIYATGGAIHYGLMNAGSIAPKRKRRRQIRATGSPVPTR
jgi:phage terminase large subunit GpA-like protein